ncbi:Spo0E family sporulation regulatory protein-aspartic acid phosphatase [Paenibacillus taichungensis]|uniref:Spo0E family sporulation regulatory protein-aspartic acid phosphatase n=1 Tax=Paenibacillus taichungensis TaxID=484184 RepID=UPI00399F148E
MHAVRELIILRDQVEISRQELLRLVENHGMQDYKVLQHSRILDELINEYYQCTSVIHKQHVT